MKKLYQETFEEVRASGRLRREIRNMTTMERGARKRRLPKAALVAAVLAAVLAGTAVAEYWGVEIKMVGDLFSDGDLYYQAQADAGVIPLESLPEEARADSGGVEKAFCFNTLSEVEEFLGLELADNPKLDQMEPHMRLTLSSGETTVEGPYLLVVNGDPTQTLYLHANYWVHEVRPDPAAKYGGEEDYVVEVRTALYTDVVDWQQDERDLRGFYRYTQGNAQVEEYVNPNGLVASIVTEPGTITEPDSDYVQPAVYFVKDNAYFSLTVHYYNDGKAETAQALLMEILDAYE